MTSNENEMYSQFTDEEALYVKSQLNTKLEPEYISFRPSGSVTLAYVEGWKILSLANEIFGFNGWSSQILSLNTDYLDMIDSNRFNVGISCSVRITLKDGTFREDIGYGQAENQKSKSAAYEKSKKEAVTDAIKRALRQFGNRLGNCAYDRDFTDSYRYQKNNSSTSTASSISGTTRTSLPSTINRSSDLSSYNKKTLPTENNVHISSQQIKKPNIPSVAVNKKPTNNYEIEDMLFTDMGNNHFIFIIFIIF